jgi:hypothetical protein
MAKKIAEEPANGVIPLTGKAADWLESYLESTEADTKAQQLKAQDDAEFIQATLKKAIRR